MLKVIILLAALVATIEYAVAYRRVCYYTNWAQYRNGPAKFYPENVDPNLCTHLIYAFAKMSGNHLAAFEWNDESTPWMKGMYERFNNLKQQNPNLKTLLAVGGWNMGSAPFTSMVASDSGRREFATTSMKFLRDHNFDGLDMDWEYPANRGSPLGDKDKFTELLKVLRETFDHEAIPPGKTRLLLTAAVAAGKGTIDTAYDIPGISKYLDEINLMTYDLHGGGWEDKTGHNSPLHKSSLETGNETYLNVEWATDYWIKKGAPREKLNIGMPLYGRTFTLADPSNNGVGAPDRGNGGTAGKYTREAGFLAYYEICEMLKTGGISRIIAEQKVPYLVKGDQWVGYDDQKSLKLKVEFAKSMKVGGIMVWALDLDDFSGSCGEGKYPLLHAIVDKLGESGTAAPITQVPTRPPASSNPPATNVPTSKPPVTNKPTSHPTNGPTNAQTTQTTQSTTHHIGSTNRFDCDGKASGFYADPLNCHGYFICAGSQSFEVICADGLMFNDQSKYCDWPSNVKCNNPQQPATQPSTTGTQPQQTQGHTTQTPISNVPQTTIPNYGADANAFCKGKSEGHYRDSHDCGMFYHCATGFGFHEPCPAGTVFNEAEAVCDYPYHVPACQNNNP